MSLTLEEQIEQEEAELAKLEAEGGTDEDTDADTANNDQNDNADGEDDSTDGDTSDTDNTDEDDKTDGDDDTADKDDSDKDNVDTKNPNDVAAKLRIERRERLKLQEELAELRRARENPTQQPTATDKTAQRQETVEERLARIEHERDSENLHKQAVEEFSNIEKEFAAQTPDYEDASKHMISSMYQGVKHAYPQLNDNQAAQFVQKRVLEIASQAARNNMNPAEVLYQMAFDKYGFDGTKAQAPAEKKPTHKADNLKNIAKNKKRSASPLIGGGQTAGANVTIDEANNMDLADFGKMSESEIDALINQAG